MRRAMLGAALALLGWAALVDGLKVSTAPWQDLMDVWMSDSAKSAMGNSLAGYTNGSADMLGVFSDGEFGIKSGVILSTGNIQTATKLAYFDDAATDDFGEKQTNVGDTAKITATFTTDQEVAIEFEYVVASRELQEFGGDKLGGNDQFYVEINGKNVSFLSDGTVATLDNLVPAGSKVNVVHDTSQDHPDYIDNPSYKYFAYSGYTKVLKAVGQTKIGENSISVCVSDNADGEFDTAMFLKADSLYIEGFQYIPVPGSESACNCETLLQSREYVCRDPSGNRAPNKCSGVSPGKNPNDIVDKDKATVFEKCTRACGGEGVYGACPAKIHPLGGAVVRLEGEGFGSFGDPEPVVYLGPGPGCYGLYTHPQYVKRLSSRFIEIGAPITGWGQTGEFPLKVCVAIGAKVLESKIGLLTYSCECDGKCSDTLR